MSKKGTVEYSSLCQRRIWHITIGYVREQGMSHKGKSGKVGYMRERYGRVQL